MAAENVHKINEIKEKIRAGNLLLGDGFPARLRRRILAEVLLGSGGCARGDLQRRFGLGPASVSGYVGGMLRGGLLLESGSRGAGAEAGHGRGRPEVLLSVHPRAFCAAGLDIGAGHLRGVLCAADGGALVFREIRRQWRDADEALRAARRMLARLVRSAPEGVPYLGHGIADPGLVDIRSQTSLRAVHIPGWTGLRLPLLLPPSGFGLVEVRPSPAMKCRAEQALGALRGIRHGAFIDLGLGVGAALIVNGQMVEGLRGLAAEFGHLCVRPGGNPCTCGARGCLETECGGLALSKRARELERAGKLPADSPLRGGPEAERIAEAAKRGDPFAARLFADAGRRLGIGLAGLVNLLNPEALVFGGGLSAAGELLLGPARNALERHALDPARLQVEFRPAALRGSHGGAVGAALSVFLRFLGAGF